MKLSSLSRDLYDRIAELEIIDAHQHLPPEKEYLSFGYSGLNMFANYLFHDLLSAGLDPNFVATMRTDTTTPVDVWWPKIKPYYEASRNTCYAKALQITARDIFGIDELSDDTIAEFAAKVKAENTPGIYRRALQEACGIRLSIGCEEPSGYVDDAGLRVITRAGDFLGGGRQTIAELKARSGMKVKTIEDAAEAAKSVVRHDLEGGAIGLKIRVANYLAPDPTAAQVEMAEMLRSDEGGGYFPALRDYLFDALMDAASQADVPVAVHTGYWGDFRKLDVKLMLDFVYRREDVHFDMFHLGMPMYRDALLIGKTCPNVSLNLCWCAVISQVQTARSLDELIDLVPVNKVTAFGGDYRVAVQKTYGHLVMAREVVAKVLAKRIEQGDFDRDYAMHLAKLWFHDNPSRIYGI